MSQVERRCSSCRRAAVIVEEETRRFVRCTGCDRSSIYCTCRPLVRPSKDSEAGK